MHRFLILIIALLVVLPAMGVAAQQEALARIDLFALKVDQRQVQVAFRVIDQATKRDIQGLQGRDIELLEDGQPVTGKIDLAEQRADAAAPTRTVDLAGSIQGSRPAQLNVVGATIGVVFDASLLTNRQGGDYVSQGRSLITAFLEAGRAAPAGDSEAFGLFLPLTVPAVAGETLRPDALPDFVQDRNAVLNALNSMAPRQGKTNVFDTVDLAVRATADAAGARGANAYLLVVTDGGDVASVGSYDALVATATARGVKLLILGVGPAQTLAKNAATLTTLAEKTGGTYLNQPDLAQTQALYQSDVMPTGQSAYVATYTSARLDDGKEHHLVIKVNGAARGESERIPLPAPVIGVSPAGIPLSAALQGYALRALPLAVVVSLIVTAALTFIRRMASGRGSSSLSGGITRR